MQTSLWYLIGKNKKTRFLLLPLCINCTYILLHVGLYFHFSWLLLRFLPALNLWSLVCTVIVSVRSNVYCSCCMWKRLFPWSHHPVFLILRSFYVFLPIDPRGWRRDGWWRDLMQDEVLQSLTLCMCPIVGRWVISYLLQEEAPLMRVK